MDHDARIDAVEREVAALVAALRDGPADTRVPTCPDFDVAALATHVGEFCGFWTHVLCEGTGRPKTPFPDHPGADGLGDWVEDLGDHLVSELRATQPATECWTWYELDQSAGFVARRVSHELAVHRVDMQLARGGADPIEVALAADGIDEIFLLLEQYGVDGGRGTPGTGQTLHLHGTDHEPAEWFVRLDPEGVTMTHEHAKGDLALRGPVSDLEMLLYQRPTVGEVEHFGDGSVLDVFHGEFTFG